MSEEITNYEDYEVLQVDASEVQIMQSDTLEHANVDVQVATAKRYPRNLKRAVDNAVFMVSIDTETAESCRYSLPRGGKTITGPSVHLAKIIVSNWGNMRTEAKVVQITDRQIISRGIAWDLENNVASAFEVRRSIIDKNGRRFNDDMITVTGNAANAIAYRNAVLTVIPKPITEKVYQAAVRRITGDLSDADKLLARRTKCLETFRDEYDISESEILRLIGKQTVTQIRSEELATLIGYYRALRDGDTTVDMLLKDVRDTHETVNRKKEQMRQHRKSESNPPAPTQPADSHPAQSPAQPTLDMP